MGNKKILVTAGSSYVGQHAVPALLSFGYQVAYTTYRSVVKAIKPAVGYQIDLTDQPAVDRLFDEIRPDAVVHLAGSNRSDGMTSIIEEGTQHIADAAGRHSARIVHYSTDVVFNGLTPPYTESDLPQPVHAYGKAKFEAEKIILEHEDMAIIRPTLIYGLERIDRGTEWMLNSLQKGESITLFTNQYRNPVWVDALLDLTIKLIDSPYCGIVHAGGDQVLSRSEFGMRMLAWWGSSTSDLVQHVPTPPNAPWPPNTTLDNRLAKEILDIKLPGVDEVLKSYSR